MTSFLSVLGIVFLIGVATALVLVPLNIAWILFTVRLKRRQRKTKRQPASVAFYHPQCGNCGGGEAVLWHAVASLIEKYAQLVNCSSLINFKVRQFYSRFNLRVLFDEYQCHICTR